MKKKILMLVVGLFLVTCIASVYGFDASSPYTVTMNFVVGADTSFTVGLAAAESTIDFNPVDANAKEVEPDSQNASTSTPMVTITNTGNVNLNFTHELNTTKPSWVNISWSTDNTVDWTQFLDDTYSEVNTSVPSSETETIYFWSNFTSAVEGTTQRLYQINSTAT